MDPQSSPERALSRRKVKRSIRRAVRSLKRGHRDGARDHLRTALEHVPSTLDAYPPDVVKLLLRLAEVAADLDGSVKVANHLRAYLAQQPTHRQAWESLVRISLAAEKPEEAVEAAREALHHLSPEGALRLLHARALLAQGDVEEGEALLWEEAEGGPGWREALVALEEEVGASARLYVVCGRRLCAAGDVPGAERAFGRALEQDARCVDALEERARLRAREEAWDQVLTVLAEALEVESTRGSLWDLKARAEEATGRSEEAIRSLQVCLRYDPANRDAVGRLGTLLRAAGRHEEAADLYAEAVEAGAEDPSLLDGWRASLKALARWEELRALCQRVQDAHPRPTELHLDVAESWVATGDPDRARDALEELLTSEDLADEPLQRTAEVALAGESWGLALRAADRLLARRRKDPTALRAKTRALEALGQAKEALKVASRGARWHGDRAFLEAKRRLLRSLDRPRKLFRTGEEIVALDPGAVDVWLEMARTASEMGRHRLALQACDRGLRANPEAVALRLAKADLLYDRERYGEAYRIYEAVAQAEDSFRAWKGCGRALRALNAPAEAAAAFARALEVEDDPDTWTLRGLCARDAGDLEEALAALDRAVADGGDAASWLARGTVLMETERWQDALHALDQVLGRDPERLEARLRKAECLLALEDPREALRCLEETGSRARTEPALLRTRIRCLEAVGQTRDAYEAAFALTETVKGDAPGWSLRARLARSLGMVTEARFCLAKAAKRLPGDPAPRVGEAEILLDLEDPQGALRLAEEALDLDRRNDGALLVRGRALAALGAPEEALRAFDEALEVGGDREEALRGRALVLVDLGRREEALEAMDRLVAACPSDAGSHYWKAVVLGKVGRWEEALKAANQALYYGGARPEVLAQKGLILAELERAEEGLKLLRSTVDGGRADPPVVAALVTLLLRTGQYEEALGRADMALGRDSRDDSLMLLKARALGGLGRWEEAMEAVAMASRAGPPPKEVWLSFAALHREQGNGESALACYDRALEGAPEDPELWKGRGRLCEALAHWEEAARSYAAAAEVRPRDEEALCALGRAYTELGLYAEAHEAYQRALAVNPASGPASEGRRRVEERRRRERVSAYAWNVLEWEARRERPATREEAFRDCQVPRDLLPEVMAYVNETDPLDILTLPEPELRELEALSRDVLAGADGHGLPRVADVVRELPQVGPGEARRVLGYIQGVLEAEVPEDAFPGTERLLRLALELPAEDRDVLTLARELGIGAYRAKSLERALQSFREEAPTETGRPPPSPGEGDRRCHRHQTPGLYQHLCGQYLCSTCIAGGRCPVCRHPVSAAGGLFRRDEGSEAYR